MGSTARCSVLIIGCGNRHRGDDAAGLLAAIQLRALGIDVVGCSGETSALLELFRTSDDVIVIDAVMTGAPPGTIHSWDAPDVLKLGKVGSSTHGLGLAEAIQLARAFRCLPARLRVYGIEVRRFKPGSAMSADVRAAVQEVTEAIVREVAIPATPSRR